MISSKWVNEGSDHKQHNFYDPGYITWREKKKKKQNWTAPDNSDICFIVIFDRYCRSFTPREESGN